MRKRVNFGLKKFGLAKASAWEKKTSLLGDGDYFLGDGDALLGDGGEIIVDSGHHNVITLCEGARDDCASKNMSNTSQFPITTSANEYSNKRKEESY